MQWTMPHRVLQIVATLIVLAAVGSFALGLMNAPQRGGRLPGQKVAGAPTTAAPIEATEATPLSQERIEGPPPVEEKPKEEEPPPEEADQAASANAAAAPAPVITPPPPPLAAPQPGADQNGANAFPPDEPPH